MHERPEGIEVSQPQAVKPAVAWTGAMFVGILIVALVGQAITQWATHDAAYAGHGAISSTKTRSYRIDINHASAKDLAVLPGIGITLAKRIVRYRQRLGPFTQPEQLEAVSRIGPTTRQRIEPWIRLSNPKPHPRFAAGSAR